ncbi:MAG: 3',5'-cyclic-nucleotide phosphodiesterase [Myxococcales bacterium]|nr:3',5'-cyclic-nucleotide phosphodiesterase [Myxococcales bacterium]MDH3484147.1 3',5'-cyclic-nucleotide phosphodiesterase [Myxococcales bacterium]
MHLRVLGCHGGETPKHRTSSFLVGDTLAVDAGAVTGSLSLDEQERIESILISHPHMDHIRDLATLADNRCQKGSATLEIVGVPATVQALKKHFFNDIIWPDFTRIQSKDGPAVRFVEIEPGRPTEINGFEVTPVMVNHTVDTSAFIIHQNATSIVYSGDTGPTEELWRHVNEIDDLQALLMEVSFPNAEAELARRSRHHTPQTLEVELEKLTHRDELPVLLYHIKPVFEAQVLRELGKIRGRNLQILQLGDEFLL